MAYKLLQFVRQYRIWAFALSVLTVIALVPQLVTAWDVLWHRFRDSAVFDVLDRKLPRDTGYGGKVYYPLYLKDIASTLGRTEASVLRSLKRLKKGKMGDKVVEADDGWYSKQNYRQSS